MERIQNSKNRIGKNVPNVLMRILLIGETLEELKTKNTTTTNRFEWPTTMNFTSSEQYLVYSSDCQRSD